MSARRSLFAALASAVLVAVAASSFAHETKPSAAAVQTLTLSIPDAQVQDQSGRQLNFYRDLVKGKTVAINFIFTNCEAVCPITTAVMRDTQAQTTAKTGVQFISISVDPEVPK